MAGLDFVTASAVYAVASTLQLLVGCSHFAAISGFFKWGGGDNAPGWDPWPSSHFGLHHKGVISRPKKPKFR